MGEVAGANHGDALAHRPPCQRPRVTVLAAGAGEARVDVQVRMKHAARYCNAAARQGTAFGAVGISRMGGREILWPQKPLAPAHRPTPAPGFQARASRPGPRCRARRLARGTGLDRLAKPRARTGRPSPGPDRPAKPRAWIGWPKPERGPAEKDPGPGPAGG